MKRVNKGLCLAALFAAVLLLAACGGEKADPDAVIEGNATSRVTAGGDVFEIASDTVTKNGEVLASGIGADEDVIFVLGGKVYFNTAEGAKYIKIKNGKIKDFGDGRVVYAKGEWIYYNNADLYMINVNDGKQTLLHQRDIAGGQPELGFMADDGEKIYFTDGTKTFYIKKNGTALTEE